MIAIDRILCPIDFSECSRRALEYAVAIGAYYGAPVTAIHVYADTSMISTLPTVGIAGAALAPLPIDPAAVLSVAEQFVKAIPGCEGIRVRVPEAPDTVAEILIQADIVDASLIVVGSHGRSGFERLLLGSVAGKVLRKSRRPVMVVPPHAGPPAAVPFTRLLCPVDFSDSSLAALELALHLAQESDGRLTLLHAIEIPPELHEPLAMTVNVEQVRAAAEIHALTRLQALVPESARAYCAIETRVAEGKAHREILKAACQAGSNLIVIGVHGRGAVDLTLFGSNAMAVIHSAHCPVLAVRSATKLV